MKGNIKKYDFNIRGHYCSVSAGKVVTKILVVRKRTSGGDKAD